VEALPAAGSSSSINRLTVRTKWGTEMSTPRSLNLRDPVDAQPAAVRFQDLVLAFSQLIRVSSLLLSMIVLSIEPRLSVHLF
jgi:hypothetical protein